MSNDGIDGFSVRSKVREVSFTTLIQEVDGNPQILLDARIGKLLKDLKSNKVNVTIVVVDEATTQP